MDVPEKGREHDQASDKYPEKRETLESEVESINFPKDDGKGFEPDEEHSIYQGQVQIQ